LDGLPWLPLWASTMSQLAKGIMSMVTNNLPRYNIDGITVNATYHMKEGCIAGCK
jgi:hypothetical protein